MHKCKEKRNEQLIIKTRALSLREIAALRNVSFGSERFASVGFMFFPVTKSEGSCLPSSVPWPSITEDVIVPEREGDFGNSIGNKKTGSRRLDRWEDTRQWHWPNPVEYISVVALPTAFYSTILLQLGGRGKRVELWFYGMAVYGETVHPLATLATFVLMDCYLEHHANHMLFWIRYFLPLIRLVGRHNKNTMSFLSKIWFAIEIQLWRKLTEDNEWFVRFFLWSPWYIFNSMSFFYLSWIVVSMWSTPDMSCV